MQTPVQRAGSHARKIGKSSVELRLKETYSWLLVPFIDQFEDMKTIQWEISDIGGGSDSIIAKAARKMIQGEQIITKWAPALLQMSLDDLLWRDTNDIQIKKLWEYLSTYCYLPRLSNYSVLEEAICQGLSSDEYFGIAAAYSEDKGRYIDLKFNQSVFTINQSDYLVKPVIAIDQKHKVEKEREGTNNKDGFSLSGSSENGEGNSGGNRESGFSSGSDTETDSSKGVTISAIQNKHFYMSAKLDNTRVNRDINNIVSEIIQHLMAVDGASVELKLEVEVEAENGIPATTVRTVSENCRTLKVSEFGFDN